MTLKRNYMSGKVKLAAVGDIMLGDTPLSYEFGVCSQAELKGYDYLFEHVKDIFQRNDLVVGNMESVVASPFPDERDDLWCRMNRGFDAGASAMQTAGIELVSLANNHIY